MKKSTKKNRQNSKEMELNLDKSTGKIQSYFKSAPKMFHIEEKNNVCENSKAFYTDALKKRLQDFEGENAIEQSETSREEEGAVGYDMNINEDLPTSVANIELESIVSKTTLECTGCIQKAAEIKELDAKYKALKNVYFKHASHYTELSLKYEDLLKAKSHINQLDIGEELTLTEDVFTTNEMKFLQSTPLEKNKDSTFVLQCLEFAYKNDFSVLCAKTLKGTAESVQISDEGEIQNIPGKGALTPIKVKRMKELFLERLSKCKIDTAVYADRVKESNINKLISSGIKNIAKRQK